MRLSPEAKGEARFFTPERLLVYGLAVFVFYIGILGGSYLTHRWFVSEDSTPIAMDFLNFWAAGFATGRDHAALIFDIGRYKDLQVRLVGHDFDGTYPWPYPPTLLLLAAPLASLPYMAAWLIWVCAGLAFFVASIRLVLPARLALPIALAAPATLWCMVVGQNGFLTAGFMGCALALIDRRPWIAGLFMAALTYKPQFGLVLPIFLLADRRWTAFTAAAIGTVALFALSALIFGLDTWRAFLASLADNSLTTLFHGADLAKLQSFYAILAKLSGQPQFALDAHAALCGAMLVPLIWLWRRPVPQDVKSAAVIAAAFLFSPHAYIYDALLLTPGIAFLARDGLARGFLQWDRTLLFLAWVCPALFGLLDSFTAPLGFLVLLGAVFRRAGHRTR